MTNLSSHLETLFLDGSFAVPWTQLTAGYSGYNVTGDYFPVGLNPLDFEFTMSSLSLAPRLGSLSRASRVHC
jgi:hypothetical protein